MDLIKIPLDNSYPEKSVLVVPKGTINNIELGKYVNHQSKRIPFYTFYFEGTAFRINDKKLQSMFKTDKLTVAMVYQYINQGIMPEGAEDGK